MPTDLETLLQSLAASDLTTRRAAAETLARWGPDAVPAAVALTAACRDPDEQVRDWVVAALEELPPPPPTEAAALAELLSQENLDVAFWAATLLGRMGSSAALAVSALVTTLSNHPEPIVRHRAAWALGQMGHSARAALPQLEAAAASSDTRLNRFATASLTAIRAAAPDERP